MECHPIITALAGFFSAGSQIPELDRKREILSQVSPANRLARDPRRFCGLFAGCPCSGRQRTLTRDTLLWSPHGWPPGKYHSLASSRLGQRLFADRALADAIRTFFVTHTSGTAVVNGQGSTLDLAVQRGSHLFGLPRLQFIPFPERIRGHWIEQTLRSPPDRVFPVYFDARASSVDELMFAVSDVVRILCARKNGNIFRLRELYLRESSRRESQGRQGQGPLLMTWVDPQTGAQNPAGSQNFGRVDWYLCRPATATPADRMRSTPAAPATTAPAAVDPAGPDSEFLSHWTRATRRPWPDETVLNRFDRLFFGQQIRSGALETLCRILVQQKLLASGHLIRNRQRVVCFTAVPLSGFPSRRVFRSHLGRWDFEPFGISIRRQVVERLGGKPVRYHTVNEPAGRANKKPDRQVQPDYRDASAGWASEREWRIAGDVDLRFVSPQDAVVFVPDRESAAVAGQLSRWPVVILSGDAPPAPLRDAAATRDSHST